MTRKNLTKISCLPIQREIINKRKKNLTQEQYLQILLEKDKLIKLPIDNLKRILGITEWELLY